MSLGKKQKLEDGYGCTYHRVYQVAFPADMTKGLEEAMQAVQTDINQFSPQAMAKFEKIKGDREHLRKGDEFQIHISGPWNGPVRVADVTPDEFRLVTLDGHLEAGEIFFRLKKSSDRVVFEIESLAKSRDAIVDFVYDKIPIAKLAQTQMWTTFCKAVGTYAYKRDPKHSRDINEVIILTERKNEETGAWEKM